MNETKEMTTQLTQLTQLTPSFNLGTFKASSVQKVPDPVQSAAGPFRFRRPRRRRQLLRAKDWPSAFPLTRPHVPWLAGASTVMSGGYELDEDLGDLRRYLRSI